MAKVNKVKLSENTKKLIKELKRLQPSAKQQHLLATLHANGETIPPALESDVSTLRELLASWPKPKNERLLFLSQALQASLLKDLSNATALQPSNENKSKDKKKGNWKSKLLLRGLAILGTIYFACEGFDGMTALLGIFSVPVYALLAGGLAFSIISVFVFISFDLAEISDNLGINKKDVPKLLDTYLEEAKTIKKLAAKLDKKCEETNNLDEIEEYQLLLKMLKQRNKNLDGAREKFTRLSKKLFIRVIEKMAGIIAGVLFFSSGFFAGQTVALFIAGLVGASIMTPYFWPIIVTGVAVGAAAALIYWFVERPGIESLIRRKRGLDPEKIEQLCDKDSLDTVLNSLESHLNTREKNITKTISSAEEIERLKKDKQELQAQVRQYEKDANMKEKTVTLVTPDLKEDEKGVALSVPSIANNRFGFLVTPTGGCSTSPSAGRSQQPDASLLANEVEVVCSKSA